MENLNIKQYYVILGNYVIFFLTNYCIFFIKKNSAWISLFRCIVHKNDIKLKHNFVFLTVQSGLNSGASRRHWYFVHKMGLGSREGLVLPVGSLRKDQARLLFSCFPVCFNATTFHYLLVCSTDLLFADSGWRNEVCTDNGEVCVKGMNSKKCQTKADNVNRL